VVLVRLLVSQSGWLPPLLSTFPAYGGSYRYH